MSNARKKKDNLPSLEEILSGDNDHWNTHALRLVRALREEDPDLDPTEGLRAWSASIDEAVDHHAEPLTGDHAVAKIVDQLPEAQRPKVYRAVVRYLDATTWTAGEGDAEVELDLKATSALLGGRTKDPKTVSWTTSTRDKLRLVLDAEVEKLPGMLDDMDPKDRGALVLRLLGYIMPKAGPAEEGAPQVTTSTL